MKKLAVVMNLFLMSVWGGVAMAELPRTINLQTMVYDLDGNVTRSEYVGVSVQIVDENGQVYFQEDHYDIPIVQGAMNLLIGEASGGISLDTLNPAEGRRFVNVLVDNTSPYDILPLSSVPYAIWADRAQSVIKDAITGENIKDGSIESRHIAGDFKIDKMGGTLTDTQIPVNIVRQEVFDSHTGSAAAHQAASIPITTSGSFPVSMGTTVQLALQNLYSANLTEVQNRQSADAGISNSINSHSSSINSLIGRVGAVEGVLATANSRISTLESMPSAQRALAWGRVSGCSRVADYNVSGSTCGAPGQPISVSFTASAPDDRVAVVVTSTIAGQHLYASNVSRSGFSVYCQGLSNPGFPASCQDVSWVAFSY